MAKIASKVIWWKQVNDAVSYNVRIVKDGTDFSYATKPASVVQQEAGRDGELEVDLAGLEFAEGTYDIYITAQDKRGNESDPFELADAVLDFVPPAAPSDGGFR